MPEKLYDHNHIMTVSLSVSKKQGYGKLLGIPKIYPHSYWGLNRSYHFLVTMDKKI